MSGSKSRASGGMRAFLPARHRHDHIDGWVLPVPGAHHKSTIPQCQPVHPLTMCDRVLELLGITLQVVGHLIELIAVHVLLLSPSFSNRPNRGLGPSVPGPDRRKLYAWTAADMAQPGMNPI